MREKDREIDSRRRAYLCKFFLYWIGLDQINWKINVVEREREREGARVFVWLFCLCVGEETLED